MGDLPVGGGGAELKPMASHSTSFSEPNPSEIGIDNWAAADKAACEIIRKVRPTSVSEERRKEVVEFIQRLIRNILGAEVLPYGSVPLKTYLPDGDIDLTTFGGANIEDTLADDMKSVLEEEEKNTSSEFVVKDVQLIRAEVKLVKCIVQDIVVDISFNQIGGLCTLCFLEQVDHLIGKDHLFKRSIILIKTWCYYESRILGAHHGLISTYGLETLVLYIFHLYHSTLHGPLAVLYKFLDYFSKFDWETYCISLNGPIRLSSLPAIVAEMPEDSDRDLLLSRDFLSSCVGMFSVPSRSADRTSRGFQLKHLNIIDPLKESNNLGRSVSKGNYYRIRSAFSYGARKLARILSQPQDSIANELHKFFANTMARHGGGRGPNVQDFDQSQIYNRPINESYDEYSVSTGESQSSSGKYPHDLLKGIERTSNRENRESDDDLATSGLGGLRISTDPSKCQKSSPNESVCAVYKPPLAPHLFFAKSRSHDCGVNDKSRDSDNLDNCAKDPSDVDLDQGLTNRNGTPEALNSSDLTGDYESYLQHLHYGRWCYEHGLAMLSLPMPPLPTTPYRSNIPWDSLLPMSHFKPNGFSHQHHNGFHPSPPVYAVQPVLLPGVTYGWEEVPKPRGTGTYFPNTNLPLQGHRAAATQGRNQAPARSPRTNVPSSHEPSQVQVPADQTVGSSDSYFPTFPHQLYPSANGVHIPPEGSVELESENSRPHRPVSSSPRAFSGIQKSQSALSKEQDRIPLGSAYRLKDEDDFPPLST